MGLDMYFSAKRYLSDYVEEDKELKTKVKDIVAPFVPVWNVREITYDVGYWRKANAIHNWFVRNVQDHIDDCKEYIVYQESIQELYEVVCEVLESNSAEVAQEKLPAQSGFFFGSTDIDESYFLDLEHTKQILQPIIDAFEEADKLGDESYRHPIYQYYFYYQSSW